MKVKYDDRDGALRLGKIEVRWRYDLTRLSLDKSKIDVRWELCPHIR